VVGCVVVGRDAQGQRALVGGDRVGVLFHPGGPSTPASERSE
jgi:hypothetical protein